MRNPESTVLQILKATSQTIAHILLAQTFLAVKVRPWPCSDILGKGVSADINQCRSQCIWTEPQQLVSKSIAAVVAAVAEAAASVLSEMANCERCKQAASTA